MKSVNIREFRNRLARLLESGEALIITRHGKAVSIVYPLGRPENVPLEVRRSMVDSFGRQLNARPRWAATSRVIERFKRDVDRTLIRENLRRTPEERLRALQKLQQFAEELRRAR